MTRKHTCQVVGEFTSRELTSELLAMSDFDRRRRIADQFVLLVLNEKIQKVFGDQFSVTVDGHYFDVRVSIDDRSLRVEPRLNKYLCEFRDFPNEKEWREGAEAYDVVNDYIQKHWKPEHGLEFLVRAGDQFFVIAWISAYGLKWQKIDHQTYVNHEVPKGAAS